MPFETLIYEKRGRIAHITLNRPEKLNAFNDVMYSELATTLADFDQDPEVWVAILSANGKAFSAGSDLRKRETASKPHPSLPVMNYPLQNTPNWKPVIAAVQGYCGGWTFGYFVLDCDLIVATEDAVFDLPEVKLAIPFPHLWTRLHFWLGSKRATEMAILGERLTAQEGYRLGLVSRVVANREELMATAQSMAEKIAGFSPMGIRATVQISRREAMQGHREAELLFNAIGWSRWEDYGEAVRAFAEKRAPVFKGR